MNAASSRAVKPQRAVIVLERGSANGARSAQALIPVETMKRDNWLMLGRSVRFGDTDAAGVVHFARLLVWCHEAYEESLERFGLAAEALFPTLQHRPGVALPIVHCSADFRRPLICGDHLTIQLEPRRLDPGSFEVVYGFVSGDHEVAHGLTRHLAITSDNRQRCPLPEGINRWLEASSIGAGVQGLP